MRHVNVVPIESSERHLRLAPLSALGAVALGLAVASCGGDSQESPTTDASANERSSNQTIASGCEAHPPLKQKQVLLACAPFTRGRELQIRTERDRGGADGCLEIYGVGGGKSRACGYVPYKRDPVPRANIFADSLAQMGEDAPLELYGSASMEVTNIRIRHGDPSGDTGTTAARFIPVTDKDALAAANLERPFAYFVAEVPSATVVATAIARGPDGAIIGRESYLPRPFTGLRRTNFIYADE